MRERANNWTTRVAATVRGDRQAAVLPATICFLVLVIGTAVLPESTVSQWSLAVYGVLCFALVERLVREKRSSRGFWLLALLCVATGGSAEAINERVVSMGVAAGAQTIALTSLNLAALVLVSLTAVFALGPAVRFATLIRWTSAAELALASTFIQVWVVLLRHPARPATTLTLSLTCVSIALALIVIAQLLRSPTRPEGLGCLTWMALLYLTVQVTDLLSDVGYPPRIHGAMRMLSLGVGLRAMFHPQFADVGRLANLDRGDQPVSMWRHIMYTAAILNSIVAWALTHGYQSRASVVVTVFGLTMGTALAVRKGLSNAGPQAPTTGFTTNGASHPAPVEVMVEEFAAALLDGQLRLHYQPVVEARTSRVIGAEALLRWQHPRNIAMPPELILHLARLGAISKQLDEWILERAIADAHDLADALGVQEPMSYLGVNITAQQLEDPLFAQRVASLLRRYKVESHVLVLELTEREELNDLRAARTSMAELRMLGVSIALDDFGSGLANLDALTHLSFDVIKLDRTFVLGLSLPDKTLMMTDTLGALQQLGTRLLLEGVEQHEDNAVEALIQQVDYVQGYAFGQPMALSDLRRLAWQHAS